jgi:hypothetical protein
MAKDKQSDFVVSDRRKFTAEGDLRPDAPNEEAPREQGPNEHAPAAVEEQKAAPRPAEVAAAAPEAQRPDEPEMPPPPTEEEAATQKSAYEESNKQLDAQLKEKLGGREMGQFEMTFERFTASLYMTALLQLGMAAPEGQQPRADIMGARQTIDTIALLQEKTKGNLTDAEKNMLQQALYELRMAWLEVMNAINNPPSVQIPSSGPGIPSGPGPTRIK